MATAADLAATTVLTAGKVAVKGTGAVVRAVIPDGDEDNQDEERDKNKREEKDRNNNQ